MKNLLLFCMLFSGLSHADDAKIYLQEKRQALALSQVFTELEPLLRQQINTYQLAVGVDTLYQAAPQLAVTRQLRSNDIQLRQQMAVTAVSDQLLQLRLAHPDMLARWQAGQSPLFAVKPAGPKAQWQYVEAFDVSGRIHQLDPYNVPEQPVLVVDTDNKKALQAALQTLRNELTKHKVQRQALTQQALATTEPVQPASLSSTVLKKIALDDNHEPWILGQSEIYAIVTGVSPERHEAVIDIVDMPYLDYAQRDYYPNQVLIHWHRYRWGAADIILMEQDSNTNYKELAQILLNAAADVMQMIPEPQVQGYALIPQITARILQAIPDRWMTNSDDFVDVFYTILQDQHYTDHYAAGANAIATLEPLTIPLTRP
ncbi:DUF3103 family protein [Rheinheimera gaetbuli]